MSKVVCSLSKYWEAHYWDCQENPLPELEKVIRNSFPTMVEARITVERDSDSDSDDSENVQCRDRTFKF